MMESKVLGFDWLGEETALLGNNPDLAPMGKRPCIRSYRYYLLWEHCMAWKI